MSDKTALERKVDRLHRLIYVMVGAQVVTTIAVVLLFGLLLHYIHANKKQADQESRRTICEVVAAAQAANPNAKPIAPNVANAIGCPQLAHPAGPSAIPNHGSADTSSAPNSMPTPVRIQGGASTSPISLSRPTASATPTSMPTSMPTPTPSATATASTPAPSPSPTPTIVSVCLTKLCLTLG